MGIHLTMKMLLVGDWRVVRKERIEERSPGGVSWVLGTFSYC
jgi:hypothetical protein